LFYTARVSDESLDRRVAAVGSLTDPVRRSLYDFVVDRGGGVGRDEAGRAVGVSRNLAAYHLDRLVTDGLLRARYERRGKLRGPGQGRPAKIYDRAPEDVSVSLPARDYEVPARLLARALEHDAVDPRAALAREAHRLGTDIGTEARLRAGSRASAQRRRECLRDVLRERGYEPFDEAETIRLRNCPFHALAEGHRDLVCGMNLQMLAGITEALDADLQARLDPRPGECCVAITRA
jgi:predicted ArsR family transcriptional regulator